MRSLWVKVKPNSNTQAVRIEPDGSLFVALKSPPIQGEANAELIDLLAKQFHVTKSDVRIKSGATSKYKLVKIDD
ncbi:MAG: DUF167 domain-containing protein [Microcoleus sp. SIO2G3]|nr:DUF167 domain-containing protein [Microcoleus sp. SIO2G3]